MHAIGSRSRWLELVLAFALGVAAALATGCGSSSVIEGELSENARKTVLQKRVDVQELRLPVVKSPGASAARP